MVFDFVTVVLLGITLFIGFFFWQEWERKSKKLPPGPRALPFLGNVLSLEKRHYKTMAKWVRTYGDIMTVKFFNTTVIVISETNLAREAYNKLPLLGRAFIEPFEVYFRGKTEYPEQVAKGILGSEGAIWQEQRRFTLRHLRDFGFGKQNAMEEHIHSEIELFHAWVKEKAETKESTALHWRFAQFSSNVMWRIVAGQRIHNNAEETAVIDESLEQVLKACDDPVPVFLPTLAKAFGKFTGWNALAEASDKMHEIFYRYVTEHQKEFSPENEPRDFMDVYLKKIAETTDENSSFYGKNGVDSLKLTASDMYIAGSETIAATLNWSVMFLTSFPEVKKKFLEEIKAVLEDSRQPRLEDKINMPYSEALVLEVLRKSSFTTYGVMHRALADTELNGYFIPKDTWIAVNQHYIHHDPKVWGDPENFRPERFLAKDEKTGKVSVKKYDELVAFSIGKRLCIGEQLAKDELFLFLTSLYQKYDFEFDPNSPKPGLESRTNMFREPQEYKVIAKAR